MDRFFIVGGKFIFWVALGVVFLIAGASVFAQTFNSTVPVGFVKCAAEGQMCNNDGRLTDMVIGAGDSWTVPQAFMVPVLCDVRQMYVPLAGPPSMGAFEPDPPDPAPGKVKECFRRYTSNTGRFPEWFPPKPPENTVRVESPPDHRDCQRIPRGGTGVVMFTGTELGWSWITAGCTTPYGMLTWTRVVFEEFTGTAPSSWPADPVIDPPPLPPVSDVWVVPTTGSLTIFKALNGKLVGIVPDRKAIPGAVCNCTTNKIPVASSFLCSLMSPEEVTICKRATP